MAAEGDARPAATAGTDGPALVRAELLADVARRQPLLAAVNAAVALLLASALLDTVPAAELALWLGYVGLAQAARLALWWRWRRRPPAADGLPRTAPGWLVAASAAAGAGWGAAGVLFAGPGGPGSPAAQQALVSFFLAGMAAGSATVLSAYPPAFHAFIGPALLPYAARLWLAGGPEAHAMGLAVLLYAACLSIIAHLAHRSLRRSAELHLENAHLVGDLERARRGLERLVERRGAELDTLMETVPAAVWIVHGPDGRRITGSRRAAEMLRLAPRDNQALTAPEGERPRHFRVLKGGEAVREEELPLQRAARGEAVRDEEVRVVFDDGTFHDELISAAPVRDAAGNVVGAVGAAVDITERKRAEERIRHMALHDPLTGLPNRTLFLDRLGQALARARREGGGAAVMLLDLDDFKGVNDTFGHTAGDRLLRAVAGRLSATVRAGDTLARLGGDEFALVQPALRGPGDAAALADKLLAALAAPFPLDGQETHVGASLGVALFPDDGRDPDALVRCADLALYRAKDEGRGRVRLFEPAMDEAVRARRRLERDLRRALERGGGQLSLAYQPQLDLRTGRLTGVEALARWDRPGRGPVPPSEFVPVAEACGLIAPLGAWALREACRQAAAWRAEGLALTVAVNVSPAQLRRPEEGLAAVDAALAASGLDPGLLELEVTEGVLMETLGREAEAVLRGLAARGVGLAIDDFGTGYSSLAYLRRLPARRIKVDRSFVRDIGSDAEDEAVVRAIVTLGHALGKEVVAEGVETAGQLAFLRALGCDAAQGFLIARPGPAVAVRELLLAA